MNPKIFLTVILFVLKISASSKIQPFEFTISARDLPMMDTFTKQSDPFARFYFKLNLTTDFIKIGKTMSFTKLTSAEWPEVFKFNYNPALAQKIKVKLYDEDDFKNYIIGKIELYVLELISSNSFELEKRITEGKHEGYIKITGKKSDS